MGLTYRPADGASALHICFLTGLQKCSFQLGLGLPTQHGWGLRLCTGALQSSKAFLTHPRTHCDTCLNAFVLPLLYKQLFLGWSVMGESTRLLIPGFHTHVYIAC